MVGFLDVFSEGCFNGYMVLLSLRGSALRDTRQVESIKYEVTGQCINRAGDSTRICTEYPLKKWIPYLKRRQTHIKGNIASVNAGQNSIAPGRFGSGAANIERKQGKRIQ